MFSKTQKREKRQKRNRNRNWIEMSSLPSDYFVFLFALEHINVSLSLSLHVLRYYFCFNLCIEKRKKKDEQCWNEMKMWKDQCLIEIWKKRSVGNLFKQGGEKNNNQSKKNIVLCWWHYQWTMRALCYVVRYVQQQQLSNINCLFHT